MWLMVFNALPQPGFRRLVKDAVSHSPPKTTEKPFPILLLPVLDFEIF